MQISPPATAAPRRLLTLTGISCGYFMVLLDSTILNVALPDIADSLHGSIAGLQWTISSYLVTFGALLLASGAVADRLGAGRVFRIGLAAFGLCSILCSIAPNLLLLIVFRAQQGVAAALIPASTLSLIGALYPEPADRHRAVGLWGLLTGIGFAAGPLLGGTLVGLGGWRLVFVINAPLVLLGLWWCRGLPATALRASRVGLGGQVVAALTCGLLVNAVIQLGSPSSALWWAIPAASVAVTALVLVQRSDSPAVPPELLRAPDVRLGAALGFVVQVIMAGALFALSLHLIDGRGYGPVAAGAAMLPYSMGPLLAPFAGRLAASIGPRRPLRWGLLATTVGVGFAGLSVLLHLGLVFLLIGLLIAGPGLPLTLVPLTSMVVGGAPAGTAGMAGGLFSGSRQIGGALGVGALGGLVTAWGPGDGAGIALLVAAGLAGLAAILLSTRPYRPVTEP